MGHEWDIVSQPFLPYFCTIILTNCYSFNTGQVCTAGSRIFVQEAAYDRVLEAFAATAKALAQKAGDPFSPTTQHGPQSSKTQFDRVMSYVESGKDQGARLVVGGQRLGDKGYFIHPTVFTDVTPDMKIVREEIFGPVGVIIKFKTEEEAIELANDTVYGLAAHIFTENTSRAIRVAHALEAGSISVCLVLSSRKASLVLIELSYLR